MKHMIAEFLNPFSEIMHNFIAAIPMGVVRALVFGILAALALWIILMPAQLPEGTDSDKRTFLSDLRLFAIAIIALQAVFYILF